MKKGKSQQRKLVVAFPKGLCLGGRTGSFGWRAKPRRARCYCTVPLLTLLPALARRTPLLPEVPVEHERRHTALCQPKENIACFPPLCDQQKASQGGFPKRQAVPSKVGPSLTSQARGCPSAARSRSRAALGASTTALLSSTLARCNAAVVSALSRSTAAVVQSSPENTGSSCSSCQRSYF